MVVKIGGKQSSINVYPNPIVGNTMNLQLQNISKGMYFIDLINTSGRSVYKTNLQRIGGIVKQSIKLPSSTSFGNYFLRLSDENGLIFTEKIIIVANK